jgi:XTP/dITP diphosphohydrolase
MKIYLITKNHFKVEEATAVLQEFNIIVEQINDEKYEPKEMSLEEVAKYNAKHFYEKYEKPVMVDDTGVFFSAYPDFPGNHPKLMFELLGYKGLLKLLEGEKRDAEFRTVIGYCDDKNLRTFTGRLHCKVDIKVNDPTIDVLPYERIMLLNGRSISSFSRKQKNRVSHRAAAFRKLGEWLVKSAD